MFKGEFESGAGLNQGLDQERRRVIFTGENLLQREDFLEGVQAVLEQNGLTGKIEDFKTWAKENPGSVELAVKDIATAGDLDKAEKNATKRLVESYMASLRH